MQRRKNLRASDYSPASRTRYVRGASKKKLDHAFQLVQEMRDHIEDGRTFEDIDPSATEAIGVILGIMRGTVSGRNLGTRLTAAVTVLERYRGKPTQKTEHDVTATLAQLLQASIDSPPKQLPAPTIDIEEVTE